MFKRLFGISMVLIVMISMLAACGASSEDTKAADIGMRQSAVKAEFSEESDVSFTANSGESADAFGTNFKGEEEKEPESPEDTEETKIKGTADSLAGVGNTIENVSNAILAERKIIRSANLTIEVEDFDEACNNINSIILGIGIIQQSNINTDRTYVDGKLKLIKNGTILLRVNKDKFDTVVNSLKGIGDVYNQAINGQDVTDRFVDTESRLRLLKLEQGRLEAYLIKLEDLDKIFKTESRLTEIRQEIESLTGNLNKMSSLVELSTITITMNEKNPNTTKIPEKLTYGEKLLNNLKSSLEGVVYFLGDLLMFVVAAIPVLLLLGLFVLLGIFIYRRIPKKQSSKVATEKNDITEEKDR